MEFPLVEVEEVESVLRITESVARHISRLCDWFKKEPDEDIKDCIKEAILMLRKETQAKKSFHLEKFVENTLLTPECELEPSTIFSFLKDIEQMTWRQLCLLEGFRRQDSNEIEISSNSDSGINGISIATEIKQLIDLNYLNRGSDRIRNYLSTSFDHIHISTLGQVISKLLGLQSVELPEIGKAFGGGRVKDTKTTIY